MFHQNTQALYIFGASGHGKVVAEIVSKHQDMALKGFLDDDQSKWQSVFCGVPVIGGVEEAPELNMVIAIGDNGARLALAKILKAAGALFQSLIDPSAVLALTTEIGEGSQIMPGVVVNPDARIGQHVILNTASVIEHDVVIDDAAHIAPNATLCGGASVGEAALVGAGSTILPNVTIGAGAIIGAGSVVLKDVPPGARVAGNPAKSLLS